ncbi:MAG: T9SS type A sorting domain-containing protein [Cytophagaceae bacterium]|nr:T9SS type A sorting domain-containing protein [Cytophagaceae bacterium]
MFSFFARQCAIVLGCFLSISSVLGQTLVPGDLVVVGYNFKDPDEFSVLPLVNLQAGSQFFITDCGWNANTVGFRPGEGLITYTVPSGGIMAGQQIHYPNDAGFATQGVSGFFGLSVAGDQLLIFQGSFLSPQFLFGLTDYNGGWLSTSFSPTNQSSHLPAGLIAGQNALELDEFLQAQFECAFPFSNREEFLRRLTNPSQWMKATDRIILPIMGCGFDVLTENSLEWNYKMEYDERLLLFVSSLMPPKEISWWYHTTDGAKALTCRQLDVNRFECELPENLSDPLLIRPCRTELNHCEKYKRIDRHHESGIVWYASGKGSLSISIPEGKTVIDVVVHSADGGVVWNQEERASALINIEGLKPGFYILSIELAQLIYRIPISLTQ